MDDNQSSCGPALIEARIAQIMAIECALGMARVALARIEPDGIADTLWERVVQAAGEAAHVHRLLRLSSEAASQKAL